MMEADIELPVLLGHLVEEARTLVGARYGALGVLNEARTGLEQFLTAGLSESEEQAIGSRPTGRGVLGLLITDPAPLRLRELGTHEQSYGFPPNHPPMESFLGVPIRAKGEVFGNLYLTDKIGADDFTEEDEALTEALALAAGIAIDNTRLHDRVRAISVLDDRERIGRDLHDRVVQRLFAVGMALQGAARLPELNLVRERIDKVVDDLDATITEIRTTIFELGDSSIPGGVRQAVVGLADELTPTLGVRPELTFQGAIDNTIPQQTADHLLAVPPRDAVQRREACASDPCRRRPDCGRRHHPRSHRQRSWHRSLRGRRWIGIDEPSKARREAGWDVRDAGGRQRRSQGHLARSHLSDRVGRSSLARSGDEAEVTITVIHASRLPDCPFDWSFSTPGHWS